MIVVDMGFWLALGNKKDEAHIPAVTLFNSLQNEPFHNLFTFAQRK